MNEFISALVGGLIAGGLAILYQHMYRAPELRVLYYQKQLETCIALNNMVWDMCSKRSRKVPVNVNDFLSFLNTNAILLPQSLGVPAFTFAVAIDSSDDEDELSGHAEDVSVAIKKALRLDSSYEITMSQLSTRRDAQGRLTSQG